MGRRATQIISHFIHEKSLEAGDRIPFGIPAVVRATFITNTPSDATKINEVCTEKDPEEIAAWGQEEPANDWIYHRSIEDKRKGVVVFIYKHNVTERVKIEWKERYRSHLPQGEKRVLNRQRFMANTVMIVSTAHTVTAERKALRKLRTMLTAQQWRQYILTGVFIEQSKRSRKLYWFRKCLPIIVSGLWVNEVNDFMDVPIVALCIHPQGYYEESTAGALCPTDNTIAELLLMRTAEHMLWRKASQHQLDTPNACF